MGKILLLFHTIKYLKLKQITFQLLYRIKKVKPLAAYSSNVHHKRIDISFSDFLTIYKCADGLGTFNFLNLEVTFVGRINWNYMDNGKLWNYNLHYANYILQEDIAVDTRLNWLNDLHRQLNINPYGLEPYPVSLRLINTIRFIGRHKIADLLLLKNVEAEANFLSKRIEYHLLGNHVLENGFALLLAGAFFDNTGWIEKAHALLEKQLSEQLLEDGGHFELSPMYHQIILYRILELIDWYSDWNSHSVAHLELYIGKAKKMLCWLRNMTFKNGDIPLMNDSANGIAYTSRELFNYAEHLNISFDTELQLSASGYRVFKNDHYECIIDVGDISVNYQPGHGHADALSFILYANGIPLLTEQGTSTYQLGKQRLLERGTQAHNTLVYKNKNQSQIWSGFRVGKRAKVKIIAETDSVLEANHDGYKQDGGIHQRKFFFGLNSMKIQDQFLAEVQLNSGDCVVNFHFHPNTSVVIEGCNVLINDKLSIQFTGAEKLETEMYKFAPQFNKYEEGLLLKVIMRDASLETSIYFI